MKHIALSLALLTGCALTLDHEAAMSDRLTREMDASCR